MANPSRKASRKLQSADQRSVSFNSGLIPASKKAEMKKAARRDATRWSNAIRAVLKQEEDELHQQKQPPKQKQVEEVVDPIGDHMTRLLNANPAFRFQPPPKSQDDRIEANNDNDDFHPLFSTHNLKQIRHLIALLFETSTLSAIPKLFVGMLRRAFAFTFRNACSLRESAIVLIGLFLLATGMLGVGFFISLEYSFKSTFLIASVVLPLLVDWKEVNANCPKFIRNVLIQGVKLVSWIDTWILQGRRFAGREWNKSDFVWKQGNKANSRFMSLWNLPPPSVKEGRRLCLDEEYMARDEWSAATTKHIVAINFCYVVQREDFVRQQADRKSGRGSASPSKANRKRTNVPKIVAKEDVVEAERRTPRSYKKSYSLDEFDLDDIDVAGKCYRMNRSMEEPVSPPAPDLDRVLRYMATDSIEPSSASSSVFASSSDGTASFERHLGQRGSSDHSWGTSADGASDLAWIDVGAKIGIRLLNSANVQRAMASQDTAERIKAISETVESKFRPNRRVSYVDGNVSNSNFTMEHYDNAIHIVGSEKDTDIISLPLSRPVHSMWTSASAVAATPGHFSVSSLSDVEGDESSIESLSKVPGSRNDVVGQPLLRPRWTTMGGNVSHSHPSQPGTVSLQLRALRDKVSANYDAVVESKSSKLDKSGMSYSANQTASTLNRDNDNSKNTVENPTAPSTAQHKSPGVNASHGVHRRQALEPGVKVVVPIIPLQPGLRNVSRKGTQYQMATVVSSKRLYVRRNGARPSSGGGKRYEPNCLTVTANLDKSFLRDGEFAEITIRVLDEWSPRYMPRHSKFPIGSCVATSYGVGVLVGWRVEDDCHVVRALWQRRGPGAAHAYLNRNAIHTTVSAAIGFNVQTNLGEGKVLAYVNAAKDFRSGRYFVMIQDEGRYKNQTLDFSPRHITSCPGARFLPIIEHVREAAQYQIQIDNYNAALRQSQFHDSQATHDRQIWENVSKCMEIFWSSFLKAIDEDKEFDEGMRQFMNSIIEFLERLDRTPTDADKVNEKEEQILVSASTDDSKRRATIANEVREEEKEAHGFWIMNDLFGGIFHGGKKKTKVSPTPTKQEMFDSRPIKEPTNSKSYKRAFAVIRALMKTVSIARAASVDQPNFKLALSVCYDFLLFVRTLVKVQQKNVSPHSLAVWRRALEEIISVFGPIKERVEKIGRGIAERMERQGNRAKVKVLRFVDITLADELLLLAVEQGEWDQCAARLEQALVSARIIAEENREHYRKTAKFIYDQAVNSSSLNGNAAARNSAKLANLATFIQLLASPRRSFLKLFQRNDFLELMERILVRVFQRDEQASRMLTIHAAHFQTIRHLRMLKDFTFAGKIWIPLIDAAEQEFSWAASRMPDNTKEFMLPLSSLFSLGVAQFHKIYGGDLTKDWLDFLLEDEAVRKSDTWYSFASKSYR